MHMKLLILGFLAVLHACMRVNATASNDDGAWEVLSRFLDSAGLHKDDTTPRQRSLQTTNLPACGQVIDEISATGLRGLVQFQLANTLELTGFELLLLQTLLVSEIDFGVRIQKVCGRCSDFSSSSTTCVPGDYGYDAVHSGLLITPLETLDRIRIGTSPVNIVCHGTQSGNQNVPSNQWNRSNPEAQVFVAVILSSISGSFSIMPDYLGYGESSGDYYRPYIVREAYPRAVWPLLQRAEEFVAQQSNCASALADSMTVVGYSEGGYAAVAVADALYREGKTIISVNAGGAPFRLSSVQITFLWNQVLQGTFVSSRRYYIALLAVVYSQTTTDALNYGTGQHMLDSTVRDAIVDIVHSSIGQNGINAAIPVDDPFSIIDERVAETLTTAVLGGATEPCVTNAVQGETDILCAALQENDLVDVLESAPYPISLCHSSEDTLVSFDNVPDLSANPNLDLLTVSGGHSNAAVSCYLPIIQAFLDDGNIQNLPVTDKTFPGGCPTVAPTAVPTMALAPTASPTRLSTFAPTQLNTTSPTSSTTVFTSLTPTGVPTLLPTVAPKPLNTTSPTSTPTAFPIATPPNTTRPTNTPSTAPSKTFMPTSNSTQNKTLSPTLAPIVTQSPTNGTASLMPSITQGPDTVDGLLGSAASNVFRANLQSVVVFWGLGFMVAFL